MVLTSKIKYIFKTTITSLTNLVEKRTETRSLQNVIYLFYNRPYFNSKMIKIIYFNSFW